MVRAALPDVNKTGRCETCSPMKNKSTFKSKPSTVILKWS